MLDIDTNMEYGWHVGALRCASPNFDARPPGCVPRLIIVHSISLPPGLFGGQGVQELFCNSLDPTEHPYYEIVAGMRVSAHFFIRRDGELIQFVSAGDRAWHAGISSWRGRERCNDFSIGIELEGSDQVCFEAVQYQRLVALVGTLQRCFPIEDIVGHADVAPGRKTDPGPFFEWDTLTEMLAEAGMPGLNVRSRHGCKE